MASLCPSLRISLPMLLALLIIGSFSLILLYGFETVNTAPRMYVDTPDGVASTKSYEALLDELQAIKLERDHLRHALSQQALLNNDSSNSQHRIEENTNIAYYTESESETKRLCDYINGRGQPKSGTTWDAYIRERIYQKFCAKLRMDGIELPFLCTPLDARDRHLGRWGMHKIDRLRFRDYSEPKSQLGIARLHASWSEELIRSSYKFCTVLIFRDPRDRELSHIHYIPDNNRTIEKQNQQIENLTYINQAMKQRFAGGLVSWMRYWNFYHLEQHFYPHLYYLHWYDDLKRNTHQEIEKMIDFIGIKPGYLSQQDIESIINETSFVNTVSDDIWMHQWQGKSCAFWKELSNETILWMNRQMIKQMPMQLIERIDRSCPVQTGH